MLKLSHSGKNKFQTCPKSYELRYVKKYVSRLKGSPLFFGSAIDNALNYMLEHKDDENVVQVSKSIFDEHWFKQKDNKYDEVELPKCEEVSYYKSDFDPMLLDYGDWIQLPDNILELRENIEIRKSEIGWWNLEPIERQTYNFSCWLSLRKKGLMFIDAYYKDIIPKIKKTIAVQMELSLSDGADASLTGFIDAIVELQDGRVAVLDNKTSSKAYAEDSVQTSEQLALYQAILNVYTEDDSHPWNLYIDCCAYAVLGKKLRKKTTKVCDSCGHTVTDGSHKTCTNMRGGKRCGGDWKKSFELTVDTQFIVDNIPAKMHDDVLSNAENVIVAIQKSDFPQNFEACKGVYGMCEYYNLCHNNSMVGLIDISKKERTDGQEKKR